MKSLSHLRCVNTNSAPEFGNKVHSCGTEDAKIFYCYYCYYNYYYYFIFKPSVGVPEEG